MAARITGLGRKAVRDPAGRHLPVRRFEWRSAELVALPPGQRYKAHLDCIDEKLAESEQGRAEGGQRTHTILLAMGNDDLEGGETWFPHLEKGAQSATGELMRFNNTDPDGQPLPNSLHEGQPVTSGEKWLLSKWVRANSTPYGREICLQSHVT